MSARHEAADPVLAAAHFVRHYGAGAFWNPVFRSTGGVIPWGMFEVMYDKLLASWATDRLNFAIAASRAIGIAFGDESKGDEVMEQMKAEAFPAYASNGATAAPGDRD